MAYHQPNKGVPVEWGYTEQNCAGQGSQNQTDFFASDEILGNMNGGESSNPYAVMSYQTPMAGAVSDQISSIFSGIDDSDGGSLDTGMSEQHYGRNAYGEFGYGSEEMQPYLHQQQSTIHPYNSYNTSTPVPLDQYPGSNYDINYPAAAATVAAAVTYPVYGGGHNRFASTMMPESSMSSQSHLQQPLAPYVDFNMASANSNRMMRNLAEKMRRDKLNTYINELATLVPMVSSSPKKMDKTSVLRLSATYLRMNQLVSGMKDYQHSSVPPFLNSINWSQLLLDDIDGVMVVITSVGKIIFISHNVEKVLGHTQLELFGQSFFNITCPEDHVELRRYLTPDEDNDFSGYTCADLGYRSGSEDSVSVSSLDHSPCSVRSNYSSASSSTSSTSTIERQRRSFYLRLRHRCLARSEQPQYELVHVMGHLRFPKKYCSTSQKKPTHKDGQINSNEIVLVAIMKPFRERRVTEVSLIEASRDEYITRHLLDGRIIYSDHRISVVSGYLSEDVSGLSAFNFMHKDDVRWVLIALRQMYWRGESYGASCYRLKTKTGELIYLKTHGYLELSVNTEQYASFICVNSLVSAAEGEREIQNLRCRFSPLIENKVEPGIAAIAEEDLNSRDAMGEPTAGNTTELKNAIRAMITNIPPPNTAAIKSINCPDEQYAKAKLMSKALPPVTQHTANISIISSSDDSTEPSYQQQQQQHAGKKSPGSCSRTTTPSSTLVAPLPSMPQNRPSVLRIAPPSSRHQPPLFNSSIGIKSEMRCGLTVKQEPFSSPPPFCNGEESQVGPVDRGVARQIDHILKNVTSGRKFGVLITKSPPGVVTVKRGRDDGDENGCSDDASSPFKRSVKVSPQSSPDSTGMSTNTILDNFPCSPPSMMHVKSDSEMSSLFDSDAYDQKTDPNLAILIANTNNNNNNVRIKEAVVVGTNKMNIQRSHFKLESRMQVQGDQLNAIQNDLSACALHNDQVHIQTDFSQLQCDAIVKKEMIE